MAEPNLIKVCLTNKGEDTETPWAADLGPAGADGSRKVKLVNVPFMHAKPTWGDTIIVKPANDSPPTWDREGVPWKQISSKIVEDGGRWAMILDYAPTTSGEEALAALGRACDDAKIVCESAWGPRDRDPGRVYLAVQKELNAEQVMGILIGASLPMELTQIHPEPKKRQRAQTMVGISDEAGRPPARAKTEPPVATTKSDKSAAQKPAKSETSTAMKSTANGASKAETSKASKPVATSAASTPVSKSETSKASKPVSKSESSKASKPVSKSESSKASKVVSKSETSMASKPAGSKSAPAAKAAPAKSAPPAKAPAKLAAKSAPVAKATPAKAAPAKAAPAKAAPAKAASKAAAKPATSAKKADAKKPAKKR